MERFSDEAPIPQSDDVPDHLLQSTFPLQVCLHPQSSPEGDI